MNRNKIIIPLAVAIATLMLSGCVSSNKRFKKDPEEAAQVNTQLGFAYMQKGEYEIALEKFNRAIDQDKRSPVAHSYLGLLYERLNDFDKAEKHHRLSVRYGENDPAIQNAYASFLCRTNNPEQAERYFDKAIENGLYKTPHVAATNAGICALNAGRIEKAESYFSRALEISPLYKEAIYQSARLSYKQSRFEQSKELMDRLKLIGGMSAESLWLGHNIEHELGNRFAAQGFAEQLREKYPDSNYTRMLLNGG